MPFLSAPNLPAAAEGAVDVDQVESDVAPGDSQLSCCCTCVVSRLKTLLKWMVPVRYCCTPSCRGRRGRLDAAGQVLGLFPRPQEAPQRGLDFLAAVRTLF